MTPSIAAILAVGLWSTNAIVAKFALADMSVVQTLTLQFSGAAVVFGILCLRPSEKNSNDDLLLLLPVAIIGLVGTIVFQYIAFSFGPIATTNLIAYAWPLLMVLAVIAAKQTRQPGRLLLSSCAGLVGVSLLVGGDLAATVSTPLGLMAASASALCMATYSFCMRLTRRKTTQALFIAAIVGASASGYCWIVVGHGPVTVRDAMVGLYLGIGPMALGYALWSHAMQSRTAGALSTLGYATPVLSTVLLTLSGETLTSTAAVGATIIVIACLIAGTSAARDEVCHDSK